MRKILGFIGLLFLLNGCAESMALLTPISTAAGGNMQRSAINTALSYSIKAETGKGPIEHAIELAKKNKKEKDSVPSCYGFLEKSSEEICINAKKEIAQLREKIKSLQKVKNLD